MTSARLSIAATVYNRPDRLVKLLKSIAAAEDCTRWSICISVEPSPQQDAILEILADHAVRLNLVYRLNDERKGVRRNPYDTIEWAIDEGAGTVLLLEDDLTIDRQALRWCEQMAEGPLAGPDVMCANLLMTTCNSESVHVPADSERTQLALTVVSTRFFSSYGLLFTRDQWTQYFRRNWFIDEPFMENWAGQRAVGWDVAMNRLLLCNADWRVLQSLVPRVRHDGAEGTHVTADFQARSFDNVTLGDEEFLGPLDIVDPLNDLQRVPSAAARMYINLSRHLWTQQQQSLTSKHLFSHVAGLRHKSFRLGSYLYMVFRKRAAGDRS